MARKVTADGVLSWAVKNWKWILIGLGCLLVIPIIVNLMRKANGLFSNANSSTGAQQDTENQIQDNVDGISYNTNNMTLSEEEAGARASAIYSEFNRFMGTRSDRILAQFLDDPSLANASNFELIVNATSSAGGSISNLTRDDLKAIVKKFGVRSYSYSNGGEPSVLDDWLLGPVFGVEKLDLNGWVNQEVDDTWREHIVQLFVSKNFSYIS